MIFAVTSLGLGAYERAQRSRNSKIVINTFIASLIALLIALFLIYFVYYANWGRLTFVYGTIYSTLFLLFFRLAIGILLRKNRYIFSTIGDSALNNEIIKELEHNARYSKTHLHISFPDLKQLSHEDIIQKLLQNRVNDVVMSQDAMNDPQLVDLAMKCLQARLRIINAYDFYVQIFERIPINYASKSKLLTSGLAQRKIITTFLKRLFDIFAASLALIVLSPLLLLIAILIRLESPGSPIFVQNRLGRYFQSFSMYKFRTMRQDVSDFEGFSDFVQSRKNDQRITRIGRILRPLHLDELPQLWNIMRGEMSVVGPRPEAMGFAQKMREHTPLYELRCLMRPGLSGLAQIRQGYAMNNVEEVKIKLSHDLYYLSNYSLFLDLQIILRTIFFLMRNSR